MSIPPDVLNQVFIRKLAAFAGYTLLVYDYLLTFSLEVAYIWDTSWTAVKALFLINRYWTLIGQGFVVLEETGYLNHDSVQFCNAFLLYLPIFVIISGESIRLLVVIRACAVLGCKRIVAVIWNILYAFYALVVLGIVLYFFTHSGPPHFEYLDETGICISPAPPNLWTILFITLVIDSFILVLIYYGLHRMHGVPRGPYASPLVRLLIRDAFMFYLATLFNSLLCIVCWTIYAPDPRNMLNQMISTPFLAVMGQHLVLNLRKLRSHPNSRHNVSLDVARQLGAADDEQTDPTSEELELGRVGARSLA